MTQLPYDRVRLCPGDTLRGSGPVWSVQHRQWVPGCQRRPVSGCVARFQLDELGQLWGRLILPMCAAHALVSPEEFAAARIRIKPPHRNLGAVPVVGLLPELFLQPYGEPVHWMAVHPEAA